jgi:RND family efflux transporter MFP subunit
MTLARKFWIPAAVLALAALTGCGAKTSAKAEGDAPAALLAASDVAIVTRTNLVAGVPVSGTLTPAVDVRLSAPMAETIDEVLVREGQSVTRGQVLARFRVGTLEAEARSAQAQLKIAAADYDRQKNLFKEGAVSQRDVEAAEAAWRVAQATESDATRRREDASVRAPVAGVISVRSVESGDRPGDGDPMFRLVNTSELEFEATVPSEFVSRIHVGSLVRLTVTGQPSGAVQGHVARINAAVDEATRQVKVYVRVPNSGAKLVGGLFASGSVVTQEARETLAAPSAGIRGEGDARFAMVIENGRLVRREVKAGLRDESRDLVEILGGLNPGDVVVTGPIEGLNAGETVKVGGKES